MPATEQSIPVATAIRRDLIAALANVRTVGNYHCDLFPVDLNPAGNTKTDGTVIVDRTGFSRPDDEAQGHSDRTHVFKLYVYVAQSQNSELAIPDKIEAVEADIEKALCQTDASSQRSANGMQTEVADGLVYFDDDSALYCLELTVEVSTRTDFMNAYRY